MRCLNCKMLVSEALEALDGVQNANASHQRGVAEVEYDPVNIDEAAMKQAIEGEAVTVNG